ncbi:putative phosphoketolase, partial [Mycobacterium marinum]
WERGDPCFGASLCGWRMC